MLFSLLTSASFLRLSSFVPTNPLTRSKRQRGERNALARHSLWSSCARSERHSPRHLRARRQDGGGEGGRREQRLRGAKELRRGGAPAHRGGACSKSRCERREGGGEKRRGHGGEARGTFCWNECVRATLFLSVDFVLFCTFVLIFLLFYSSSCLLYRNSKSPPPPRRVPRRRR